MSVCWEQDPLFRPTAAQIRMVASCPQFCHLADAVSMETQAVVLSACSISGCDSVSGSVSMLQLPFTVAAENFQISLRQYPDKVYVGVYNFQLPVGPIVFFVCLFVFPSHTGSKFSH